MVYSTGDLVAMKYRSVRSGIGTTKEAANAMSLIMGEFLAVATGEVTVSCG